jgi:hypothetical protein
VLGRRTATARHLASVQRHLLDVVDIQDAVLVLSGGDTRAVLEVGGVNLPLKTEAEQDALLSGLCALLNGLDTPVQLVFRATRQDIDAYLDELRPPGGGAEREAVVRLRLDHAAFVRDLAARRALVEHRTFLVVAGPKVGPARRRSLAGLLPGGFSRAGAPADAASAEQAFRQLAAGAEELRQRLQALGLAARRLDDQEIAEVVHAALAPRQAALQRLRAAARPQLVVRAETAGRGARAASSPSRAPDPAVASQVGFARGTLGLVDLLAPAAVEVSPSYLRLEDVYVRTLALVGYPRYVRLGWLRPLLELDEPLDIALHLFPLESAAVIRSLTRKLVQLHSSRLLDARAGKIADAEREVACADVERLRDELQRGQERVFATGLYLTFRAESATALEATTRRIESTLGGLMAQSRRCILQQPAGLRSTVPWGRDHLLLARNLDTTSVATTAVPAVATLSTPRGVLFGAARGAGTPVILDPFSERLENASMAVFAKSGAGKSYAVKLLLLRSLLLGRDAIVVDPEGEYAPLCRAADGQEVRLGAASPHVLNPFDLPATPATGPEDDRLDPLTDKVLSLLGLFGVMLADPERPLGRAEVGALDRALHAAYRRKGINPDPATHLREPPTLADLHAVLREQGDGYGMADRLERYVSGSLRHLFRDQTNVDLSRPLVAFGLRDLDDELRPLATYLIADHAWTRARGRPRRPCLFVAEEAWSVVRHAAGAEFLLRLAKRGRKHWLGLVTVTQDVEDLLGSAHGRAVVANSSIQLLLKQDASSIDAVAAAFKLTEGERRELLAARPGDGLLCALGTRAAIRVEASASEHALITTNPAELAATPAGPATLAAVEGPAGRNGVLR